MDIHRTLLIAIIIMVIASGALTIAMLWAPTLVNAATFFKLIGTLGILIVLAALVLVLKTDLGKNKSLKDNNYID